MIYFIQNEANRSIKIGYTGGEVSGRLRQLQTSSSDRLKLLGSIPGTEEDEKFLHRQFDSYRLSGEWFRPHIDLICWIEWLSCRPRQIELKTQDSNGFVSSTAEEAIAWLSGLFLEKRRHAAEFIRDAAKKDGITIGRLFDVSSQLPIRKYRVQSPDGAIHWEWVAENGWPLKDSRTEYEPTDQSPPDFWSHDFNVGDTVSHPEYGLGRVSELLEGGKGRVAFAVGPARTFIFSKSPMRRVCPEPASSQ